MFDAEADTLEKWDRVSSIVKRELEEGRITPLFDDQTGPTRDLELYDAFGNRKEESKHIPKKQQPVAAH